MVITGGIFSVLDVIVVVLGLLGDATGQVALALFGDDVGDVAALGLEVVFHHARLIFAALILEHGLAVELTHTVKNSDGMNLAAVHVHADLSSRQVNVAIYDLGVTVHRGMAPAQQYHAVLGIELHHMVQIHPLANKAARVARSASALLCHRLREGCVALTVDNRVHHLRQVERITVHLTMRQTRQQHECCHHRQDDMKCLLRQNRAIKRQNYLFFMQGAPLSRDLLSRIVPNLFFLASPAPWNKE